jgi:hypothetical protein
MFCISQGFKGLDICRSRKHNIDDAKEYHKTDVKNGQSQMTLPFKNPLFQI